MKFKFIALIIPILFLCSACEKAADLSAVKVYENINMLFSYPANWQVTEDEIVDDVNYLFVESPDNAVFLVQVYNKKQALSLERYVKWFSEKFRKEMPVIVSKGAFVEIQEVNNAASYKSIEEKFMIMLQGENIPHIRKYSNLENEKKAGFLITQAAYEDVNKDEPGFKIIRSSFVLK